MMLALGILGGIGLAIGFSPVLWWGRGARWRPPIGPLSPGSPAHPLGADMRF